MQITVQDYRRTQTKHRKARKEHGWTKVERIEMYFIWVNLKNVGPPFFNFMLVYIKISFTQRENHSQLLCGLDFANDNNNQRFLVRVALNSKADKPVALISGSNWNLVLVFVEEGKPENPEKNPRSRDENQQQTQPTCDAGSGYRTWATAVGGKRSHHCAIP